MRVMLCMWGVMRWTMAVLAHLRLWSVNKRLICSVNLHLVGQQVGWFACLRWQGAQVRVQQPRCLF